MFISYSDKNEITGKDSCTLIKLNDPDDPDYGLMELREFIFFNKLNKEEKKELAKNSLVPTIKK